LSARWERPSERPPDLKEKREAGIRAAIAFDEPLAHYVKPLFEANAEQSACSVGHASPR
jgi:hypothetical protein